MPVITPYTQVMDSVYLGTNLSADYGGDRASVLRRLGIEAVLNVEGEKRIPPDEGVTDYFWMAVQDETPLSVVQLEQAAALLHDWVEHHKKVYVHCRHGQGRSPMVVAAYLMRYKGMTPEEALHFLSQKRPEIKLNPFQLQTLYTFATSSWK